MDLKEKLRLKTANPASAAPVKLAFLGDSVTHGCFEIIEKAAGASTACTIRTRSITIVCAGSWPPFFRTARRRLLTQASAAAPLSRGRSVCAGTLSRPAPTWPWSVSGSTTRSSPMAWRDTGRACPPFSVS